MPFVAHERRAATLVLLSCALGVLTVCGDSTSPKCALSAVSLSSSALTVAAGENTTLYTSVTQTNCTESTTTWSSSASNIASVANGVVTGVSAGNATITATVTTENASQSASAQVTVTPAAVSTVTIDPPSKTTILIGENLTLTAKALDSRGNALTGRAITWTSGSPNIASVNATSGVVTGVIAGTATISASSEGKPSTPVTITVIQSANVAFGYVIANNPTAASYTPTGFNGAGQTNQITRTSAGVYTVTFNGLGSSLVPSYTFTVSTIAPSANATLTQAPAFCTADNFTIALDGRSSSIPVRCINQSGVPTDAQFNAMVIGANVFGGSAVGGRVGAFTFNNSQAPISQSVSYAPDPLFAWNSNNAPMSVVKPAGSAAVTHTLGVTLPGADPGVGTRIINSISPFVECSTGTNFATGVTVTCLDRATGNPINAIHTVLAIAGPRAGQPGAYAHVVLGNQPTSPFIGVTSFTSASAQTTVTRAAPGKYTVTFTGLTIATPFGVALNTQLDPVEWHTCTHFVTSTSPVTIDVTCFDRTGTISESWGFGLLVLK